MKELIIDVRPFNKELIIFALENGVKKIIVDETKTIDVHKLGKILTIAVDGDIVLGKDFVEMELNSKLDEEKIVNISKKSSVLVKTSSWKIIPLENLVSKSDNIFAYANVSEIKTLLGVLEKGVSGIVLKPKNISEIKKAQKLINSLNERIELVEAEIINIKTLSVGDRACIDTCSIHTSGQGLLIGNSNNFLFLINSESVESSYCDARPFRINAGAIHSYVLLPNNKTKYLSELNSSDEVLVVRYDGLAKNCLVGRNKIEERPLILIEALYNKTKSSVILQNAETIRLVKKGGLVVSVSNLKIGEKVLVRIDSVGRHFGQAIKEKIVE